MIGTRTGSRVIFTYTDLTRVNGTTFELSFSDYSNAVVVGSPFENPTTAFYQNNGFTHLTLVRNANGTISIIHQPDDHRALIVSTTSLNSGNDYFVMQSFQDNGHTVILVWGLGTQGTVACGVYFNMNFGNLSSLNQGSYVVHWQDTNGNGIPDPADTFTVVYSGS